VPASVRGAGDAAAPGAPPAGSPAEVG